MYPIQNFLNIVCFDCGVTLAKNTDEPQVFQVSGALCGCKKNSENGLTYIVSGYTGKHLDFEIPCWTFLEALQAFKEKSDMGAVVSCDEIPEEIQEFLNFGSVLAHA